MPEPQLVIMAAGIGSRYGGLKQIDPMGPSGEIIIDYSIYDALEAGFGRIVFIIRDYFEDEFRERIGNTAGKHAEVRYVYQETDIVPPGYTAPASRTKPWGTGHAILCAKSAVDAPSAVINADDFYGAHSFKVLYDYLTTAQDGEAYDYCMVGYILENTLTEYGHVARGVCSVGPDGFLESVVERTKIRKFGETARYSEGGETWIDIPDASTVSMNLWGFTPSVYPELETRFAAFLDENINSPKAEFFIPTVVNQLLSEGKARVKVLPTDEKWFGVTYQEDKPKARTAIGEMIARGVYPEALWGA